MFLKYSCLSICSTFTILIQYNQRCSTILISSSSELTASSSTIFPGGLFTFRLLKPCSGFPNPCLGSALAPDDAELQITSLLILMSLLGRKFKQIVALCDWPFVQAVLRFLLVRTSTAFDSCFRIVQISWFIYVDGSLSVNNKQISLRFLSWIGCYIQL